jgi:hypothetical protein
LKSVQYLSRTGSGIKQNEEFVIYNVPVIMFILKKGNFMAGTYNNRGG